MAEAMRDAVVAGRKAFLAGRIPRKLYARRLPRSRVSSSSGVPVPALSPCRASPRDRPPGDRRRRLWWRAALTGVGARPGPARSRCSFRRRRSAGGPSPTWRARCAPHDRRAGARLFVNDRVDVALAWEADGVHLAGFACRPPKRARSAPGSFSASRPTRRPTSRGGRAGADRDPRPHPRTPSKLGYGPPLGFDAFAEGARLDFPLLALGISTHPTSPSSSPPARTASPASVPVMAAAEPRRAVKGLYPEFSQGLATSFVRPPYRT